MKRFGAGAWRILKGAPLASSRRFSCVFRALVLLFERSVRSAPPRKAHPGSDSKPATDAASIVIPNWNGRDLLAKVLPSVIASIETHPGSEIIVVDNGSEDGSATFIRENFPQVRVLALDRKSWLRRRLQRRIPRRAQRHRRAAQQ